MIDDESGHNDDFFAKPWNVWTSIEYSAPMEPMQTVVAEIAV